MAGELIRQIVIALGGVVVGYLLGRWERCAATAHKPAGHRRWREVVGRLAAIVAVAAFVVTYLQGRAQVDCFREYFTEVSVSLADRSAASGATNDAEIRLLEATLSGSPAGQRQAIVNHIEALRALNAAREASPSPAPPECGT